MVFVDFTVRYVINFGYMPIIVGHEGEKEIELYRGNYYQDNELAYEAAIHAWVHNSNSRLKAWHNGGYHVAIAQGE